MKSLGVFAALLIACAPAATSQLDLLAAWQGNQAGGQFGIALAIGGDANHDGRADLAIGASTNDDGGENAGKVSIFLGQANPPAEPDLEIVGAPGSFFGAAVSWAGDVDGDGYDDLLVGAFRDDDGGANAGKAYLFLGGDPLDATPDLVLVGPAAGAYFGRAVSGAGDLNGDELADFAVGAPRTTSGSVFVYFGNDPPDATPDLVITGIAEGDRFGASLAGPGNADAEAGDDLLVGAPRASTTHFWQGAIYLFSGGPGLDTTADWSVEGDGAGDQLGTSVAGAGDVNGDGEPDLLAGAPYRNVGGAIDAGTAYVFYGGASLDETADFVIDGIATEENLGRSVACCGDVTGSGFSHVLAGVPGSDVGGMDAGGAVISPGGDPPSPADLISLHGEHAGNQFGYAVAGVAAGPGLSFTGSSRPDICVGAWAYDPGGKCYLYGMTGGSGIEDKPGWETGVPLHTQCVSVSPNPASAFVLRLDRNVAYGGHDTPLLSGARSGASLPIELRILALDGALVRSLPVRRSAGQIDWEPLGWDGRSRNGTPVPSGVYFGVFVGPQGPLAAGRLTLVR